MTDPDSEQIVLCPHCQSETTFIPVLRVKEGSRELKNLIAGKLNRLKCLSCDRHFLYDSTITYYDDDKRFFVHYIPAADNQMLADAVGYMDQLYRQIFTDVHQKDRPNCRLTIERKQLIEKITIHQHGYDDRLIEYIKYQLFQNSPGLKPEGMDLLFDFSNTDHDNIMFIAFDRTNGKPLYSMGFTLNDYRELETYFLSTGEMEKSLDSLYRSYYVHVADML